MEKIWDRRRIWSGEERTDGDNGKAVFFLELPES